VTTYQANKLVTINANNENKSLIETSNIFQKPMGLAFSQNDFAIATKYNIESYKRINDESSNTNYYHKLTYHTGDLDIHDLYFWGDKILFVNTKFSCLCSIDVFGNINFEWKPFFIEELRPFDNCHINGLAYDKINNKMLVTALGINDKPYSWYKTITTGGALIDVNGNRIVLQDLPMPHSPRFYKNKLYMLFSATGEIVQVDIENNTYQIINSTDCFIRGLDIYKDYLFVGVSKQRRDKSVFKELPIAGKTKMCGVKIYSVNTGKYIGEIEFVNEIEELFDVRVIQKQNKLKFVETNDIEFVVKDTVANVIFKPIKNKYYD